MQNSVIDNSTDSLGDTRTIAQAEKPALAKSAPPAQTCVILDLDELSEDPDIRRRQLHEAVRNAYAEARAKYEASHDDIIKNGTDTRGYSYPGDDAA